MTGRSTVLRDANPTLEEGRAFARYLDQAAEGFFRFWLGRRAVDIVAAAFIEPDHDVSYQRVTFAEREGIPVGMVSGYTSEEHKRSSLRPLERAAGRSILRMAVIGTLCAPMLRILDTIADGDFYLQAIAVDQECRGAGVGSSLIDLIEERAVASGASRLTLDVSAANEGARRLYERRGMVIESRWPKRLKVPGVSLLRMTKGL